MECLGINPHEGTVYEGRLQQGFRIQPPPLLVPIKFIDIADVCVTKDPINEYAPVLFREDSFDPVTRVRRGRVFALYGGTQPHPWKVDDVHRDFLLRVKTQNLPVQETSVLLYARSTLQQLASKRNGTGRPIAILGDEPFLSVWVIVDIEKSAHGTPILTLKSQRSFGTLPDLDSSRVPEEIRVPLTEALGKVEDSAHRLGAEAVIDRCRDSLSVVFAHACGDRTLDLGPAIKKLEQVQSKPTVLAIWAGQMVARFHSRAKPNEQEKHGSRVVTEDDAQLALNCLGLVLREQGWAKPD